MLELEYLPLEEGLCSWGWFSMEQTRHWGTSQCTPVPGAKGPKGWEQDLPRSAWQEGETQWHLLKLREVQAGDKEQKPRSL